ncbi:peptidase [Streptomyces candidus]|nr:peptidase [Streptomyces candidus]
MAACLVLGVSADAGAHAGGGLSGGAGGVVPAAEPVPGAAEVERLYREAGAAVKAHEASRKAVGRVRGEVVRLRAAEGVERARLARLRDAVGELARSQYRRGGGSLVHTAGLLAARSPEDMLERVSLAGRGGHATATLMARVRESRARLARDRAASTRVLGKLRAESARRAAARRTVEKKLREAQGRLRAAEERRRAAASGAGRLWGRAAGGAPGPACGSGAGVQPLGRPPAPSGRAAAPRWVKPVDPAPLSSGFAETGDRWAHRHTGQDFAVFDGEPVRAVGDGTVHFLGCGDGFGKQVILRHANGYYTQYAHLSVFAVREGQRVVAGETIGLSGRTGNVSGPHLHFEVRVTPQLGSGVDPLPWLREHGVTV